MLGGGGGGGGAFSRVEPFLNASIISRAEGSNDLLSTAAMAAPAVDNDRSDGFPMNSKSQIAEGRGFVSSRGTLCKGSAFLCLVILGVVVVVVEAAALFLVFLATNLNRFAFVFASDGPVDAPNPVSLPAFSTVIAVSVTSFLAAGFFSPSALCSAVGLPCFPPPGPVRGFFFRAFAAAWANARFLAAFRSSSSSSEYITTALRRLTGLRAPPPRSYEGFAPSEVPRSAFFCTSGGQSPSSPRLSSRAVSFLASSWTPPAATRAAGGLFVSFLNCAAAGFFSSAGVSSSAAAAADSCSSSFVVSVSASNVQRAME
jgi:hypothetical protein